MRTIGKVKLRKLVAIVDDESAKAKKTFAFYQANPTEVRKAIMERVPEDWFDIWESAWSEIDRTVDDRLFAIAYGKVAV